MKYFRTCSVRRVFLSPEPGSDWAGDGLVVVKDYKWQNTEVAAWPLLWKLIEFPHSWDVLSTSMFAIYRYTFRFRISFVILSCRVQRVSSSLLSLLRRKRKVISMSSRSDGMMEFFYVKGHAWVEEGNWFFRFIALSMAFAVFLWEVDDLYYLCLFSDMAVRSLRDLRAEHLPLLKRIHDVVVPALAEKHGVAASSLLAYVLCPV